MNYNVIRSDRRTISIEICSGPEIVLRVPYLMKDSEVKDFANKHKKWIEEKLELQQKRDNVGKTINDREEELKAAAFKVIPPLVNKYSEIMGLYPASVKITSAKTRFGSCSGKNALCFSWRLMAYSERAVEYVVVHELAHIKHHNHGKLFYKLIEKYLPDYKERQKLLTIQ